MNTSLFSTNHFKKLGLILALFFTGNSLYALIPNLTITTSGSTATATIQISGADPSQIAKLYYTSGQTHATQYQQIGITDGAGALTATIGQNAYNISSDNPVFVMVNEVPSASIPWPLTYTISAETLTISQPTPTVTQGQTLLVPITGGSGFYSITEVTGPNTTLSTIVGKSLSLYGNNVGSSTIKVCANSSVCSTANVSVVAATSTLITPISISVPIKTGETTLFPLAGGNGTYYLTAPITTPFKAIINGNFLSITGVTPGTNVATVCTTPTVCQVFMFSVYGSIPQTKTGVQYIPQIAMNTVVSNDPVTPKPAEDTARYLFNTPLSPGMKGAAVLQLQKRLQLEGYLTSTPNGYYGAGTTAAVKEFQRDYNLKQTGAVGPGTRAALNAE